MGGDSPGNLYDRVEGRLRERFSRRIGGLGPATNLTYLAISGPKAEKLSDLLEPVLFVVLRPTEGSGVGDTKEVLVQGFGD